MTEGAPVQGETPPAPTFAQRLTTVLEAFHDAADDERQSREGVTTGSRARVSA